MHHIFPYCSAATARTRLVAIAAAALLAASLAHADIVYAPLSIVNHGSYITDTVDHLDWYRFDNAVNTLDISFDAALAAFAPLGWGAASLSQVQGLQGQFGWVSDSDPNFSLTDAMAGYLGYTGTYFTFGIGLESERVQQLRAMTSETFFIGADLTGPYQQLTLSETFQSIDADGQSFLSGDVVAGDDGVQLHSQAGDGVGTWLVRASASGDGCGRASTAPCDIPPIPPVPEPETWALTAVGLVGMLMRRHRRRD